MAKQRSELTDEQWAVIAPLLPDPKASLRGGPKPIVNRPVFEGILWVLRTGARWKDRGRKRDSPYYQATLRLLGAAQAITGTLILDSCRKSVALPRVSGGRLGAGPRYDTISL